MIFAVSGYISFTFYGNTLSVESTTMPLNSIHIQMLIIQILGIISIISIMYAYQKLIDSFFLDTKLSMLAQQAHFQKQYVDEAQARYMNTTSLRHDMKNHIMIIKGLLEKGEFDKAKTYIEEMDIATTGISFSFQTNNPVLDILLENKMALANSKNIHFNSSLKVPFPCPISDMDFCIIISNAFDNAIHACEKLDTKEKKYIRISSRRQEELLLIEIENSFNGNTHFKQGIGLCNIKWNAEKYGGTIDISTKDKIFCLSVLLVISQHPQNIS